MSNAWFRAYTARLFPKLQECIQRIRWNPDLDAPDIFQISSEILDNMVKEYGFANVPSLRTFTWKDYMGDEVTSEESIEIIRELFKTSPELFTIDRKNNKLILDLGGYNDNGRTLRLLMNELPVSVEKRRFGNKISMKLDEIERWTDTHFKKKRGLFRRRKG